MPSLVCRICFKKGIGLLELKSPSYYLRKLTSCIPEIDVFVIGNAGLCMACALMLDTAYELREICLKNDKKHLGGRIKVGTSGNQMSDNIQSTQQQEKSISLQQAENVNMKDLYKCNICQEEFPSCYEKTVHKTKIHNDLKYTKLRNDLPSLKGKDFTSTTESSLFASENEQTDCGVGEAGDSNSQSDKGEELIATPHVCDICKTSFKLEDELKNHKMIHSAICCSMSFPSFSLLQMHTYKEHGKTCGICDELHFTFSALFAHLRDHLKYDWFKCNVCYKQFKYQIDLTNHSCKCYKCGHCKTGFYSWKRFEGHMETHKSIKPVESELPKEPKQHICKICDKVCKSRAGVIRHMALLHKIDKPRNCDSVTNNGQSKLYQCQLCLAKYHLPVHLKVHMLRIHLRKKFGLPAVDCRIDPFYREQEGLQINFAIPEGV